MAGELSGQTIGSWLGSNLNTSLLGSSWIILGHLGSSWSSTGDERSESGCYDPANAEVAHLVSSPGYRIRMIRSLLQKTWDKNLMENGGVATLVKSRGGGRCDLRNVVLFASVLATSF